MTPSDRCRRGAGPSIAVLTCLVFAGPLFFPSHTFAQRKKPPAAEPMRYAVPAAAAPGATTEVTFYGPNTDNATGLWTSFPADVARVPGERGATFRLTLPADVPVGIGAVRLATPAGASSLQLFMVDDVPSIAATGTNASPRDAQPLPVLPIAVDAAAREAGMDYYKVTARKGQRISIELVANRLGSRMDPTVRLLDATTGRELAWSDDAPGAGADARLSHTAVADGDYLIEVRDVNYDGGTDYRYRLRVGDFPLPVSTFPLAVKRGTTATIAFTGDGCDALSPIELKATDAAARAAIGVKRPGGQGSGFTTVRVTDAADVVEAEPNDAPESATPVKKGATISARFDAPGDRDYYRFDAKKGNRIMFRGRTRSLGSPCDVSLRLLKADGSKVAESKVASIKPPADGDTGPPPPPDEGTLDATIPEDGPYLLLAQELNRGGGPGMVYRLEIDPVRPGFDLTIDTDKVDADTGGGSFTLKVTCARRDYTGPITLSLAGDGKGFAVENNVIGEGKTETQLKVKVPADVPSGTLLSFSVIGEARIADKDYARMASTLPALRKLFPRMPYPPAELDGLIGLGIKG